jgi:hypothetical protein
MRGSDSINMVLQRLALAYSISGEQTSLSASTNYLLTENTSIADTVSPLHHISDHNLPISTPHVNGTLASTNFRCCSDRGVMTHGNGLG